MPKKYKVSVSWAVGYDVEIIANSPQEAQENVYKMGVRRVADLAKMQGGEYGYIDDSMFIDGIEKIEEVRA